MHLFDKGSKRCSDADVNKTLYVLDGLLVIQVQSELVLHLPTLYVDWITACFYMDNGIVIQPDTFLSSVKGDMQRYLTILTESTRVVP